MAWKVDGYSDLDIRAWNVYASLQKKNLSGYNMFLRERINEAKASKTWEKLTNCNIYDVKGWSFKVDINVENDFSGVLYLGTSKYSMLKEFEGTFSVNKYTFEITGLSEKTKYYFYIKNSAVEKAGRTGIYCKETGIGKLIDIDIGYPAIDRESSLAGLRTAIMAGNPANAAGTITTVEVYAYSDMIDCEVATFFVVSGNKLSTRDWEAIGTVTAGSKQRFTVNLDVQIGDYIGIKWQSGSIERYIVGGDGLWHTASDQIPCTNYEFSFGTAWIASLYGIGKE
ncbi:hypothetical protein ES705_44951 [subsurface metagenome]